MHEDHAKLLPPALALVIVAMHQGVPEGLLLLCLLHLPLLI